ncbi:hydantoinase B/oxoprolinase family protein [Ottowia thiooxydans]|uniref:N-methylhydantoinase B n=1 Tax=Ottowia thiooxydans TaxID=219182 RepID=A0ABV2Q456_9BURK
MAFDKRNLQVLANYCAAAADAMAYTLLRTAYSAFVKETEDFSCTIVTRDGLAFASPRSFGAPWYSGIDYSPVLDMIESYEPGDICITNDSYSGGVATHSPDIHIWKPVFFQGEIVCFVVGHIHNTDVGGAVPASLSRSLTEIVQEGIRVPPLKIMRAGKLNEDVAAIMRLNVRAPRQNWGDFNAQIASVNIGERKILEIIDRFGVDQFKEGAYAILDYAEQQARSVIESVPDGEYFFADFADEDGDSKYPCRVALTLRVKGGAVELDYTGSDPQLASSLNMPTGGRERHPLALVGLTYVLYTLYPGILLNAGTLRVARAVLPRGTVVNCVEPAAVGMRSLTCMLTQIVTFGAFAQALPEKMPVSAPGGNAIMNVKTNDRNDRPVMASIGPVGGGGGGTPFADGPDGMGGSSAFLKNTPVEVNEVEVPIRFLRYGLQPDTAGPGRYRGGLATVMSFEVSSPNTVVTARNRNRSRFNSWGAQGGGVGTLSRFTKNPGTDRAIELGNIDVVACEPGDVIQVIGPGAGGWGNPFERQPHAVLRDVQRGFLSAEKALEQYGVVVADGQIDEQATRQRRAEHQNDAAEVALFDFGPNRTAYERIWTPARYALLTEFLSQMPVLWRHFLKHKIFAAVTQEAANDTAMRAEMEEVFAVQRARFAALTQIAA